MAQTRNTVGSNIPTTNVWDVSEIYQADLDPKLQELLIRLYQNLNIMALSVNLKQSGYYPTSIFVNGGLYFPTPGINSADPNGNVPIYRQVFRKVINFGVLPNTATKSVAHGIIVTPTTSFTNIYATSTDPVNFDYIPIPYASATNDNIEINVDATNVNIITNSASWITYTLTYVVLEYITT